ncbi:hypothetical protein [Luteolibacter sp.]|uniref:hypothetical protein n=1 Tax=Luteolibacter sp. TaxID=1962973 RepID=UPI003264AB28
MMTAVGLSTMMDKRFKFSSGAGEIKRDVALQAEEVADLSARYELRSATLLEEQTKRGPLAAVRQQAEALIAASAKRKSDLLAAKDNLRGAITAMDAAFANYRADYRRKTWAKAVGQEVGNLAIRGGREYRQVTITKVTDVGLEIRHEHGIARIQAPDLDAEWQDRFQWTDEERRARLKEESDNLDPTPLVADVDPSEGPVEEVEIPVNAPSKRVAVRKVDDTAETENLERLRTLVVGWKSKVSRLQAERAEASSNAGYGNQTSVPGSLETWKAKASRLGRELSRAQTECTLAKAKLAAISPDDPLLQVVPGQDH